MTSVLFSSSQFFNVALITCWRATRISLFGFDFMADRVLLLGMTINPTKAEPALAFCRLLREGRLYEAEAWLKADKPAQYDHRNVRCTPIGIAVDTGFHSVLELLLRNGFAPTPKHLSMAVSRGKPGLVKLLLDHSADVRWMNFGQVVYWPHPEVLKMFIEH